MPKRILACALCCAAALAQTLTVEKLAEFIHSATHEMKGKQSDKEIAGFIARMKLTDRLDDATIEEFQNEGAGPLTVAALRVLGDRSANLPAAKRAPLELNVAVKTMPPPSSEEQAAILDSIRSYALNYSQSLPDFVCYETMQEYQAPRSSDRWTKLDNDIESKLTYFQQKEDYKPVLAKGKLTNQDYDKLKGSKSIGDFGSMMRGIFEPSTQTRFEWRTWSTWDGQPSITFDYHVSQDRSNYRIDAVEEHRSVISAYNGYFVVDKRTRAVVKLNLKAEELPADFPVKSAESTLVYRETELSGHMFLLPSDLEVISSRDDFRTKIAKRFSTYRKYSADSEITFDSVDTPPVVKKK